MLFMLFTMGGSKKQKKEKMVQESSKRRKGMETTHTDEESEVQGLPPSSYGKEDPPPSDEPKVDLPDEKPKRKRKRKRKRKAAENENNTNDGDDDETDEKPTEPDPDLMVQDTIFVEGIPFETTHDQVKDFFVQTHGIPAHEILELRLPTWQDTGRLRGFGHVRFASSSSYQQALNLNGKYLGKRYLSIQPSHKPGGNRSGKSVEDPSLECPQGCCTIYVNNLPYSVNEETIAQAVSKHVKSTQIIPSDAVRIARNSVTRESKGFCYIDFETSKGAQALMKASIRRNLVLGGRILRLDYDTGRAKGSFRTESGRLLQKHFKD